MARIVSRFRLKPSGVHHERRADERDRHRDERHERGADRAHEEEHHEADDEDRLGQRLGDLLERVLHEHRRVVREVHLDVRRQRRRDALHLGLQAMRDVDLVHADERPDAEVHGLLLAVLRHHVRLFGAELHLRHVAAGARRAAAVGDDEILELLHRAQVGVGEQVDLDEVALRLADGGEVVVAPQRGVHVARREVRAPRAGRDRSTLASRAGARPRSSRAARPASSRAAAAACGRASR